MSKSKIAFSPKLFTMTFWIPESFISKNCSDDGGLKVKVIRWQVAQFLLDVLLSDPIKVPTSSPQNQTIRHIFSSSVYISFNPPHNWSFCVFWFCSTGSKCFFFLSCSVYHFTFGEIYVFAQDKLTSYTVHNFPKKCDAYIERGGLRWNRNYKTVFTPTNIANLSFQKMLKSYRGSLQTEIAFWLLFISCYEKLQPSRYHLQVSKFQHQKISTSQKCVIQHCFSSSGSSLMRKVELSNKPSVKSLQGNKSTTLF